MKNHRLIWGFSWKGDYYIFMVLPFGLSTACYVFTKMLRPLIRLWRGKGIRCVLYIDDGIVMAQGREEANTESKVVRDSLEPAGLVVNEEKSCWAPSQDVVWLGFIWNMGTGCICIPEEKLKNLKGILQEVEKAPCIRARQLASITGKIITMGLAVGPVARLRTRNMYCLLNTRQSWQDLLQIEENVKDEFTFWVTCVDKINGQKLWRSPAAVRVVYSDASSTGYGGYLVEHGNHVAHGVRMSHHLQAGHQNMEAGPPDQNRQGTLSQNIDGT